MGLHGSRGVGLALGCWVLRRISGLLHLQRYVSTVWWLSPWIGAVTVVSLGNEVLRVQNRQVATWWLNFTG